MRRPARLLAALVGGLLVLVLLARTCRPCGSALALAGCLVLPGLGWARKMRLGDLGDTVALAVVLSICTTVAVGTAMAVSGLLVARMGPGGPGAVIGLAGFVPARLLADRAGAAVRLRSAGVARRRRGLGGLVRRETAAGQGRAAARAAVTASEASAVWVDWYADVERRAAEERAREAAAKQAAVDEWISWYQQTQLLTNREDARS